MTTAIVIGLRILAVALLGAAVYYYSTGESDWSFASAVLSACSYFLSLRFRFKAMTATATVDDNVPVKTESTDQ